MVDFTFIKGNDSILVIEMQPQEPVGGWSLQFQVSKRIGADASGLINKYLASGQTAYASGLALENSGAGIIRAAINAGDTSGWNPGNYQYLLKRTDSGNVTNLARGSITVLP